MQCHAIRECSFASSPNWLLFILFSCIIALARTSSTRLNKSDNSIFVLFLMLGENHSVFTIKYNVSCGFFIDGLYQVGEVPFFFLFVEWFYYENVLDFVKWFFLASIDVVTFFFIPLIYCITQIAFEWLN